MFNHREKKGAPQGGTLTSSGY